MDTLSDLIPFLPVFGIILIGAAFSLYICVGGVPNSPELLHLTPDIEAPLLVLDPS